ncbi:V-set domain containing T-cell activation inhibitor 1-like isoform X3 [Pungitius pungitius]|uniref:V-set domain containing T-cell activation inhibitor 1-like isoform X3 n=1 Tax=Pungitius pungitius TaxID=134920 RepID=UPI002E12CF8E
MLRSLPAAVTVLICAAGSLLLNVRGASTVEIVTFVGQTVILPCGVQNKNVLNLDWIKRDGTMRGALAFAYANGCEKPDKHDNFTHRSQLFLKEVEGGNMSLRLSDVRRSDAGTYTCTRRDDSAVITCTVELSVGAASEPTLAMVPGEDVTLQCEASCWSPKPDVTFLDAEGNVISAEEPKYSRDPQSDCYSVTRRATVQAGNNFTCRVNQSEIGQTRKTEIHIPERVRTLICTPSSDRSSKSSSQPSPNPSDQDSLLQNTSNKQRSKLHQPMGPSPHNAGAKPAASTTGNHPKSGNLPKNKDSNPKSEIPPRGGPHVEGSGPVSSPDLGLGDGGASPPPVSPSPVPGGRLAAPSKSFSDSPPRPKPRRGPAGRPRPPADAQPLRGSIQPPGGVEGSAAVNVSALEVGVCVP